MLSWKGLSSIARFCNAREKGAVCWTAVFNIIGYFERIDKLGFSCPEELIMNIIMDSLHDGFNTFRGYSLQELHGILVQVGRSISEDPQNLIKDLTPLTVRVVVSDKRW